MCKQWLGWDKPLLCFCRPEWLASEEPTRCCLTSQRIDQLPSRCLGTRGCSREGLDGGRWILGVGAEVTTSLLGLCSLQLQQPLGLTKPVVLIWGNDAEKLMEFVYKNRKAYVWIELKEPPAWVSTSGLSLASAVTSTLSTSSLKTLKSTFSP